MLYYFVCMNSKYYFLANIKHVMLSNKKFEKNCFVLIVKFQENVLLIKQKRPVRHFYVLEKSENICSVTILLIKSCNRNREKYFGFFFVIFQFFITTKDAEKSINHTF